MPKTENELEQEKLELEVGNELLRTAFHFILFTISISYISLLLF